MSKTARGPGLDEADALARDDRRDGRLAALAVVVAAAARGGRARRRRVVVGGRAAIERERRDLGGRVI